MDIEKRFNTGFDNWEDIESWVAFMMMEKRKHPLNTLRDEIHKNAVEHGWWEEDRNLLEITSLCHSELSEAVEEYRAGRPLYYEKDGKPEGIATEMIDCVIRILDWCGRYDIDVDDLIRRKIDFNKKRPYKHGKRC